MRLNFAIQNLKLNLYIEQKDFDSPTRQGVPNTHSWFPTYSQSHERDHFCPSLGFKVGKLQYSGMCK